MKKKILILGVCALVLTTGCSKKLSCTREEEGGTTASAKVSFKKDEAQEVAVESIIPTAEDFSGESEESIKKLFKESYEIQGYENIEIEYKNKKLNIKATQVADKYFEENVKSYDDVKKYFEGQGYTCK